MEKPIHAVKIAGVQGFLKVGPMLDHLLLLVGQYGRIRHVELFTNFFFPGHDSPLSCIQDGHYAQSSGAMVTVRPERASVIMT